MKFSINYIFSAFFMLMSVTFLTAQTSLNSSAKMFSHQYQNMMRHGSTEKLNELVKEYELLKINGEYYIGVLAIVEQDEIDEGALDEIEVINDTRLEDLWTLRVPISEFSTFCKIKGIKYIEVGEPVSEFLDDSVPSARVDSVHAGLGGLAQEYRGKDVVVAIIDWGFDYTHPNFYDTSLTNLRLVRAWDQNKINGTPPSGYNFGAEYIGMDNLLNAGSDTNYVFGYSSHGTHVAGIAGGAGGGTIYTGAAPDAHLIFISLRRDAPSLIDAFSYISNYAASVNKPFVVNMSFGSHLGPHDGTSLKNKGIDIIHGPGKVFVGSAGNNGTASTTFHLEKNFKETPGDTIKTVVNFASEPEQFGQTLSMWGSENSDFAVSVLLTSSVNDSLYQTPYYSSLNEPHLIDTILIDTDDTLIVRIQSTAKHFLNDKPNIRLEVKKTTANHKVVLHATSENTHLHTWNNVRMNNRYTNWGVSLTGNYPGAITGDSDYGLGEPAGVGRNVITVGSYRAKFVTPNGNTMYGDISSFSSKGPTVDGRVKPDISSTGQNVTSSVNSYDINFTSYVESVEFEGKTYGWRSMSGTSMSGPMVTGIVALILQANPLLSATQVKNILKKTARLDDFTGEIGEEGHLQWGWGKANALAAVKAAEVYASTDNLVIVDQLFNMYPNPTSDNITIELDNNKLIQEVEFFQVDGKASKNIKNINFNQVNVNISELPKGLYIVRVNAGGEFAMKRLVIQ